MRIEEIPLGSPRIREFVCFPWLLYRNDPCWTPPPNAGLLGSRILRMPGLLTPRHSYHRRAEVTHFMVWKGGHPAGRISAAINHCFNDRYAMHMGFFGFFEVIEDYEVARTLLDAAGNWLARRGAALMRGPGEYSCAANERQGVLIEGFEHPPAFGTTYNLPYYAAFLERYGLEKAKDYHAYVMDVTPDALSRFKTVAGGAKSRHNVETRPVDKARARKEAGLMRAIYNDASAENWSFLPVTEEEAEAVADGLRLVADSGLIRLAFVNGEPAAMAGVLPDPNYHLRPRWRWYGDSDAVRFARLLLGLKRIPRLRSFFIGERPGFRKAGLDSILLSEAIEHALKRGYRTWEASLISEDNALISRLLVDTFGARRYKTWQIYQKDLPR